MTLADTLRRHGLTERDVVPSDVPGSWTVLEPCPGGVGCRHAFRGALGSCDGGTRLTVSHHDPRRERGRFTSPFRTWAAAEAARRRNR